ncbi:MAG: universal stress protein [Desulfobacterales bacterium]|jgi:nucleotide-binding universal stress UspA family protein
MSETILVGIDGSEENRRAVDYAVNWAKKSKAKLVLTYVIKWSPYSFQTPEENEARHKRREEEIQTVRERVLEPMLESLESEGLEISGVVHHGQVADSLIYIAKKHAATDIVVGRIGESGVKTLIFGSVVAKLIQLTHIPVTIVP